MRGRRWPFDRFQSSIPVVLACLAGLTAGTLLSNSWRLNPVRADDAKAAHGTTKRDVKAPIQEVLHCPLAFAGVHLLKDLPEHSQVAYHYCKPLNDDVSQCILYDGTGPDARLIGVEYLVTDAIYQTMPAEEKLYWHDHTNEIDAGLFRSLTQTGAAEAETLAVIRPLWGKIAHTWATGKTYPMGPPRLFWAVTGKEPFVLSSDVKLPAVLTQAPATHQGKPTD
ncbi:MAG: DUF1264 domain-containing protein [Isosphaeraceae bacterium]